METPKQVAVSSWSDSRVGRQRYGEGAAGWCLQGRGFGRETAVVTRFGSETCDVGVGVEIAAEYSGPQRLTKVPRRELETRAPGSLAAQKCVEGEG